jgi:DNA-binding NtrC family response regulator
METPFVLTYLPDRTARNALRRAGCELLAVSSPGRLLKTELPRAPRLLLIRVTNTEPGDIEDLLLSFRRQWPLTDIILWSPEAGAATVRHFFHAGVKDVILSRATADLVQSVQQTLDEQQILPRLNRLSRKRSKNARFEAMLSRNAEMWDLFDLCSKIAPTDATVLIVGETGTGKELLARALHRRSGRPGRFVAANCASLAPELINSELFGHEKGAFTGADRAKRGLVRHADQGTLFLDEIGDMPSETQQSLLRLLQEKQVRPVGSQTQIDVNVRIVAATNVQLDEAVREGRFREDLFYRLDVIRMNVPALRDRPEDILFIFGHFTKKLAKHYGLEPPSYAEDFLDALLAHDWPGNVRQMENFCERLVLSRPQRVLTDRDFIRLCGSQSPPQGTTLQRKTHPASLTGQVDASRSLEENLASLVGRIEPEYLRIVLQENAGRVGQTADQAGISRRTLLRKMKQYGIDKRDFRSQDS